jgi:adenosine/AMP kinase
MRWALIGSALGWRWWVHLRPDVLHEFGARKEDCSNSEHRTWLSRGWWQHVRVTTTTLSWDVVPVDKPDDVNVVIGQSHFIKTVEDLHEAIVGVSSSLRFGLAFCEASGPRLVRRTGNDPELVELATRNALAIAAGHCFVILLRDGFPVNILNPVKAVPEVCTIHCATANPVDILVAVTPRGRGIVGVVDGQVPLGVETDRDVADRHDLLRAIGYKL